MRAVTRLCDDGHPMKKLPFVIGGIAVVALLAFALLHKPKTASDGAKPVSTPTQEPELVPVPRTQLAAAKQEIDRGAVLVIDVRDAESYVSGHIPGALQIPLARIQGEVDYLPKDKPILTYCT